MSDSQNSSVMILPNFLIIGAARSGTTTLFYNMLEHPDIYLHTPKRPEPHFFLRDEEYNKGISYYSEKYFGKWTGQSAIGEASTSYIFREYVPARIQRHIPNVKLIVALRHPVERAFSNYWHTVKSGLETLSFDEAIQHEVERTTKTTNPFFQVNQPFAYAARGLYFKQLSEYLKFFPRKQLHIFLFDDLVHDPAKVIRDVFCFLKVDTSFVPKSLGNVENTSTPSDAAMSMETRKFLLDFFEEDTENLSRLLQRDLSAWRV